MNWAPLTLAVVFGGFGITMMLRRKAPRTAAVLAALALLCLLAGIPSFLAELGHPLKPGLTLLVIVAAFCVSLIFFYLDVIRGEHKTQLFGRKGGGGAPGQAGTGGGKHNHHVRPLVSCVGLAMASLLLVFNFSAVAASLSGGFSQTFATFAHHRQN